MKIDFGKKLSRGNVKRTVLTGKPNVVNTIAEPTRCAPVDDTFAFAGGQTLEMSVSASSLTVIRIKE